MVRCRGRTIITPPAPGVKPFGNLNAARVPGRRPCANSDFGQMLITQALRHGLSVVGSDAAFDTYGVTRLW
jgi:hypothetical protein